MKYTKKFRSKMRDPTPFSQDAIDALCSERSQAEMCEAMDLSFKINELKIAKAEAYHKAHPGCPIV